jgi:uncharacterized protein YkwD
MNTTSLRSFVSVRRRPLLLILFLIAAQSWASLPAHADTSAMPFHVMLPLMLMGSSAALPDTTPEQQVVALTNALRQQHGCPALQISPELTNAARSHSQDMADHNYFNHLDANGHTPKWRAEQAGYQGSAGTENIAAGYATAQDVVMGWYNEIPPNDGHRLNILNCSLTDIGIGFATNPSSNFGTYWTQDFGQR